MSEVSPLMMVWARSDEALPGKSGAGLEIMALVTWILWPLVLALVGDRRVSNRPLVKRFLRLEGNIVVWCTMVSGVTRTENITGQGWAGMDHCTLSTSKIYLTFQRIFLFVTVGHVEDTG